VGKATIDSANKLSRVLVRHRVVSDPTVDVHFVAEVDLLADLPNYPDVDPGATHACPCQELP
jgi:hypothetical protein